MVEQGKAAGQSLGLRLRAITWPVQGQPTAPDNLYDWLIANNRYPQYRGRAAAMQFINEQALEIARLHAALESGRAEERERVVAWLRENAASMGATSSTSIATYIESGEHVANERPDGR